jgi:glycosyltransferase involved in cell wall biosynthesis
MIKVLGLALYGPLAASTRYRLEQYKTGLSCSGIDMDIFYLLNDRYLKERFSGGYISWTNIIKSSFSRIMELLSQNKYDLIIIHCELFSLVPGWFERLLIKKNYIYDFDDAFYLKYRIGKLSITEKLLGSKFDIIMKGAKAITAGNHILANYAKKHNSNTHYFPTVVDIHRYLPDVSKRNTSYFTVGWIGSPSTAAYLSIIIEPLSLLGLEGEVKFVVIGGKAPYIPNVKVVEYNWSEQTEVNLINSFDVGVMPLTDENWTKGKCAFKLIQYLACEVPVIASPVGANIDVVSSDCGILAKNSIEWISAFRKIRDLPNNRRDLGIAGRKRVKKYYSLEKNFPILEKIIRDIVIMKY